MRLKEYNYIYGLVQSLYREYGFKLHLSMSEIDIFYILYNHDYACLQSALYKESSLSRSTVNSAVKKLEKEGIVHISEKDGRNTHITVTEDGKAYMEKTIHKLIKTEENFFNELSEEDYKKFIEINRAYCAHLQKELQEV